MTTFAQILHSVSEARGVPVQAILSTRRCHQIAHARQEVAFLARNLTTMSLPSIGKRLDRDHTTILHSLRAVKARMSQDDYRNQIEAIEESLKPQFIRHNAMAFSSTRSAANV